MLWISDVNKTIKAKTKTKTTINQNKTKTTVNNSQLL